MCRGGEGGNAFWGGGGGFLCLTLSFIIPQKDWHSQGGRRGPVPETRLLEHGQPPVQAARQKSSRVRTAVMKSPREGAKATKLRRLCL